MRSLVWAHLRHPLWHVPAFLLLNGFAVLFVTLGVGSEEMMVPLIATCFAFCSLMPLVSLRGAMNRPPGAASPDALFATWALVSGIAALVAAVELWFWGYYQGGFELTRLRPLSLGLLHEVGYVSFFLLFWTAGFVVWAGIAAFALLPRTQAWAVGVASVGVASAGLTYASIVAAHPLLWFVGAGIALLALVVTAAGCLTLLNRGGAAAVGRRWLAPGLW
ncbi:MAG TPA: hypothetical protein PKN27_02130 [Propionibacteriaceae bacterium]|nr:hypothetical protein [Propionibacteriaceae bacterium]